MATLVRLRVCNLVTDAGPPNVVLDVEGSTTGLEIKQRVAEALGFDRVGDCFRQRGRSTSSEAYELEVFSDWDDVMGDNQTLQEFHSRPDFPDVFVLRKGMYIRRKPAAQTRQADAAQAAFCDA